MHLLLGQLSLSLLLLVCFNSPEQAGAQPLDDPHIEGYALAVLEQDFNLVAGSVQVQEGFVRVRAPGMRNSDRNRLMEALGRIRGVRHVEVVTDPAPPAGRSREADGLSMVPPASQWFPQGRLFEPLHADPRWPHFAASARSYQTGGEGNVDTAFAGDFGETLALYRHRAPFGTWDIGVQAGVFSLFDIGAASKHLLNADYLVGLITSYRAGDWSLFVRYLHESSHLGDEFLLNGPVTRTNVSYEMVDAKVSWDVFDGLRLYGGLGTLVRRDPSDLSPLRTQYGIEVESPSPWRYGLRPVAYADVQTHCYSRDQQNQWITNLSVRAGVQFEHVRVLDRRVQLLAEYYTGRSPNGQFFLQRVETVGLGLHVYF